MAVQKRCGWMEGDSMFVDAVQQGEAKVSFRIEFLSRCRTRGQKQAKVEYRHDSGLLFVTRARDLQARVGRQGSGHPCPTRGGTS